MTATTKGGSGVDDLALAIRSPVIQDGGGISTEWRERYGHY